MGKKSLKSQALESLKNILEGGAGGYIGNKLAEDDKDDEADTNQQVNSYLSEDAEDDDFDTDGNPYAALESLEDLFNGELDEYGDDASNLCDHQDDVDVDD